MHWALLLPEMDSLTLPCCSDMLVETTIPVLAQPPCPSGLVSQPRRHSVPHPYVPHVPWDLFRPSRGEQRTH